MAKQKILIVEDERIVAEELKMQVEGLGFTVCGIVSSGEAAIRHMGRQAPDLVLMDIYLEGEMDGIQAAGHIRRQFGVPVIYVTAYTDDALIDRLKPTEPHGYITKPVGERDLKIAIQMALHKHRIERKLKNSEARYRDLYENAPTALFSVSAADYVILDVNKKALELFGYDRDTLIGMNVFDLYIDSPDGLEKAKQVAGDFRKGGPVRDVEMRMKHRAGHSVWVSHSVEPIRDSDGNIIEIRFSLLDVTRRKELEAQLIRAQKMESIGTLAGGIAHDFNNILSCIIGYSEIALFDQLSEGSPARRSIEQVVKAGDRARDIVKQILTFSRQTELEPKPLKISLIVKEALKLLRASIPSTIEIREDIQTDAGCVLADPSQIHQVIMNLCTNAGYAMRMSGGILEMYLSEVNLGHEDLYPLELTPGRYLKLTIKDTGPGIDRKIIGNIFDPYFTTKPKEDGTGLGLSVVLGIVHDLNGTIDVKSEPGQGTTFEVFLPEVEVEPAPETLDYAPIPTGTERILFVDDEAHMVDSSTRTLQSLGYTVTARSSGTESLDLFRARPDDFDLVITDQTMPGLTGDKLARAILRIRPDMPIILCTGFSEIISKEEAAEIGIRAFVMKPVIRKDLARTIRRVIESAKG